MPRKYVRKTTKGSWTMDQLEKAVQNIREKGTSIRSAAKQFNIPYSTLRERLVDEKPKAPRFGANAVFSIDTEKKIADHCLKMSQMFYGLTKLELTRAVYVYAEKNGISHRFNKDKELAGRDWLDGFLKRNQQISVRKPEATSLNRIKAFNKEKVNKFYQNLEEVMSKYNLKPDRIYNFDETGKNVVHRPNLVLAAKGIKQVGSATSGERGKTHTVACAVSAGGHYIPPMIIFPRVRMSGSLTIDGPAGAIYRASKSGWMNEQLFLEWLIHFKNQTSVTLQNPILLILDNHTSHCTVEAFDFCVENGIVVLSIPPHTSHRLQPLDLTIFGPLNTAFDAACDTTMKTNSYMKITSQQIPSILNTASTKTCSIEKAVNGFKSAGIYSFNRNKFSESEFYVDPHNENVGDEIINTSQIEEHSSSESAETNQNALLFDDAESLTDILENASEQELIRNGFVVVEPVIADIDISLLPESPTIIEFAEIVPVPSLKNTQKSSRKQREKQHSEVMTSPEYKLVLDEKRRRREIREQKKLSRNNFRGNPYRSAVCEPGPSNRNTLLTVENGQSNKNIPKKRGRPKKFKEETLSTPGASTISKKLKFKQPVSKKMKNSLPKVVGGSRIQANFEDSFKQHVSSVDVNMDDFEVDSD